MENETLRSYSATVGVNVLRSSIGASVNEGERLGFAALEKWPIRARVPARPTSHVIGRKS